MECDVKMNEEEVEEQSNAELLQASELTTKDLTLVGGGLHVCHLVEVNK